MSTNSMKSFVEKNFKGLKIEKPLFYNWPIGIRFEIGSSDVAVINEKYFNDGFKRAIDIFEYVFHEDDDIAVVYQELANDQKIDNNHFIFKQIVNIESCEIEYSTEKEVYSDAQPASWARLSISGLKVQDLNYKNLLLNYVYINHRENKPHLDHFKGECYIINISKKLVLNLYDNRGMDLIASDKETLKELYLHKHEWILKENRDEVDDVFF